jgi:hypothetical protein
MRDGSKLLRYTLLALLVMPIAIGYASTRQDISTPLAVKAIPAIKWSLAATISDGTPMASALHASGGVPGTFSYTAVTSDGISVPVEEDTVLAAGDYTIVAVFTPRDETRYQSVTATVPLTINEPVKANLASR